MNSAFENRQLLLKILFFILMALLIGRLFTLTILENDKWASASTNLSIKTVYTSAPRGEIRDRYGRLIAGNKTSYDVQLISAEIDEEKLNDMAIRLIDLFEQNGDEFNDTLPIMIDENGNFYYSYHKEIADWLESEDLSPNLSAEDAFNALRIREGVDESLSVYDAQKVLQSTYNIYPPISVKAMEYTSQLALNNYLESLKLDQELTAKEAFEALREKYKISDDLSVGDVRKILVVRNALKSLGYKSYMPAEIATDVSNQTVITIEENAVDYPGVNINRGYYRYYPNLSAACHILGYLGKISESEKEEYTSKGYSETDLIGKEGIEKHYESVLKGKAGEKKIMVNANGRQVEEISTTEPSPGDDVYLTIDLELQKTAEDALKQALEQIRVGGTFKSKYGNFSFGKAHRNASVGACVAVDVNTGEVLALANYPGYDPNLFAKGISSEDWNSLQGENPRDPLSPLPLYNVATMSAVQPGSTFKPVTALTALDNGWNPSYQLYDNGYIDMGSRTFGCWIWNDYKGRHGWLTIQEALEVSCNYFFYDLGSGYDFYRGSKLPIDMNIGKVMDYAKKLGLGQDTGLELAETSSGVPSEERKIAGIQSSLRYKLIMNASTYFKKSACEDDEKLSEAVDEIVSWTEENPSRSEIKSRLEKLPVLDEMVEKLADTLKSDYFANAKWTTADALNLSIGQGENAYSPIQMARYVATIANGGTLHDLTLTKSVEGQEKKETSSTGVENSNDDAYRIVREGMQLVAQGAEGSARKLFSSFPYKVGAKTGTAQKSGKINPPDEVEYIQQHLGGIAPGLSWEQVETEMNRLMTEKPDLYSSESVAVRRAVMNLSGVSTDAIDAYKSDYDNFAYFVSYAPAEDPQIAVVCLIFQGGSGSYAGPVAREVIGRYMELQNQYADYQGGSGFVN